MNETLIIGDRSVELDHEGFLVHLSDWNEQVAHQLAARENIALSPEHMAVIQAVRCFYAQFQLSPAMRALVKFIGRELGADKGSSLYLLKLFPGSPAKVISKLAGLPKPDNCL